MKKLKVNLSQKQIAEFCRQWKISELALFGSVLRDDFGQNSDLDILVTFDPKARWSLLDQIKMEQELTKLLGRKVDLVSKRAVEKSSNWLLRQEILTSAKVIYGTT